MENDKVVIQMFRQLLHKLPLIFINTILTKLRIFRGALLANSHIFSISRKCLHVEAWRNSERKARCGHAPTQYGSWLPKRHVTRPLIVWWFPQSRLPEMTARQRVTHLSIGNPSPYSHAFEYLAPVPCQCIYKLQGLMLFFIFFLKLALKTTYLCTILYFGRKLFISTSRGLASTFQVRRSCVFSPGTMKMCLIMR